MRVARDKELWKWTRIEGMELYRDKKYFTGVKNRITGTKLADLQDLTAEELAWIVSRVKYADFTLDQPLTTNQQKNIFRNIELEGQEEQETGEQIIQLEKLGLGDNWDGWKNYLSDVDDQLLARALTKIRMVILNHSKLSTSQA